MKRIICFLALALSLIVLSGCSGRKTTIDFEKCVDVSFTGYNGEGTAYISPDSGYLFSLLGDMNMLSAAELVDSFTINPPENNGTLSNGDKVTVEIGTDKELLKNAKVAVKNTELSFTVSGLKDKPEADIFTDVSLAVSGSSPYCEVSAAYTGDISSINNYSFKITAADGTEAQTCKNGDKVTVSLIDNAINYLRNDYIIKETSRDYVVQADSTYILSPDDLDGEGREKLNETAQNCLNEQINNILSNKKSVGSAIIAKLTGYNPISVASSGAVVTSIDNVEFNSAYVGTAYEKSAFGSVSEKRYVYFFYDADLSHNYKSLETRHCLLLIRLTDAIITEDGISYSNASVGARADFQTAYSELITSDFGKLS